jgi:hypothetical protein
MKGGFLHLRLGCAPRASRFDPEAPFDLPGSGHSNGASLVGKPDEHLLSDNNSLRTIKS